MNRACTAFLSVLLVASIASAGVVGVLTEDRKSLSEIASNAWGKIEPFVDLSGWLSFLGTNAGIALAAVSVGMFNASGFQTAVNDYNDKLRPVREAYLHRLWGAYMTDTDFANKASSVLVAAADRVNKACEAKHLQCYVNPTRVFLNPELGNRVLFRGNDYAWEVSADPLIEPTNSAVVATALNLARLVGLYEMRSEVSKLESTDGFYSALDLFAFGLLDENSALEQPFEDRYKTYFTDLAARRVVATVLDLQNSATESVALQFRNVSSFATHCGGGEAAVQRLFFQPVPACHRFQIAWLKTKDAEDVFTQSRDQRAKKAQSFKNKIRTPEFRNDLIGFATGVFSSGLVQRVLKNPLNWKKQIVLGIVFLIGYEAGAEAGTLIPDHRARDIRSLQGDARFTESRVEGIGDEDPNIATRDLGRSVLITGSPEEIDSDFGKDRYRSKQEALKLLLEIEKRQTK